jgi:hypothetical protein
VKLRRAARFRPDHFPTRNELALMLHMHQSLQECFACPETKLQLISILGSDIDLGRIVLSDAQFESSG